METSEKVPILARIEREGGHTCPYGLARVPAPRRDGHWPSAPRLTPQRPDERCSSLRIGASPSAPYGRPLAVRSTSHPAATGRAMLVPTDRRESQRPVGTAIGRPLRVSPCSDRTSDARPYGLARVPAPRRDGHRVVRPASAPCPAKVGAARGHPRGMPGSFRLPDSTAGRASSRERHWYFPFLSAIIRP